jgi:signal peptidase II
MLNSRKVRLLIVIICGLFLFIDQFLKRQAIHSWNKPKIILPYIGWEPFLNRVAAFGLPVPNQLIIFFTLPIIALLIFIISKEQKNARLFLCWLLIFTGAISNLIDRIFHNYVIDYLAIITGIINIADILIVFGLGLYLLTNFNHNSKKMN